MKKVGFLVGLLCSLSVMAQPSLTKSNWVYPGDNGKLVYNTTKRGDRIIDFSHAGYMGGGVVLPYVPAKITVHPLGNNADCTDYIQKAIDMVSALPEDENGFRGAVLLAPGRYVCERPIQITTNGVVLRGSGSDPSGSVIVMAGGKHTAIVMNNGLRQRVGNRLGEASPNEECIKVTDKYIPAGSYQFTVADASKLSVGDNIEIRKPVTEKWIKFMKMDDLVRDGKPQTWIKAGRLLIAERTIAAINGNIVTLTVPLVDNYDAKFTDNNTTVVVANNVRRLKQCGVENLRIESPAQAVNHTKALYYALRINGEDCWAKDINAMETMESIGVGGRRITLQQINVVRKALHQGASKPAEFAPNGGQILVDRCSVAGNNIWFVALGAGQTGPIVFLNCNFKGNGRIEGHQRWTTGMLFDNCRLPEGGIDFKNRGSMGSGHGWGTAWSVAWNCEAKSYVNQLPPGTCNWVIGSTGESTPLRRPFNRTGATLPVGIFDAHNTPVTPQSLYLAQLKERMGETALQNIGYGQTVGQSSPATDDYIFQGGMQADAKLAGKDYKAIHEYMHSLGWDYSEHPNISRKDHYQGVHCEVVFDPALQQHVFQFTNHAGPDALDSDRGRLLSDRQRNEMKSQTNYNWRKLNGNWNEWQRLEWKFRIPKGFQPSTSFCHLHQLKAQEGNNGAPLITISTRSNSDGSNKRVQVIHTGDNRQSSKGVLIDNLPLSDFEDEWIQVETEMHYTHHGTFRIKLTRISDSKVLVNQSFSDVDLWRKNATNIRNKFGIYRSLGRKMQSASDRPDNGIKDESLQLADFKVYEAHTNPNSQPHD
ncbi:hypothetical protein [uncultured Bacteroides sp.]|uniref:hypothetical protein n=1 Tax=uncultured Bacteroides sp. TaxID=162156 RepID=UPI0025F17B02|nr:hypothetical protein [uncultured Bacteroides sp.]